MKLAEHTTILKKAASDKQQVTVHYGEKLKVTGYVESVTTGKDARAYVKAVRPQLGTHSVPLAQVRRVDVG